MITLGMQSETSGIAAVSADALGCVTASNRLSYLRSVEQLIAKAQGEYKVFVCSTGAASGMGSILTAAPGSSKIFLGAEVPYHQSLLASFLRKEKVTQAVCEEVALAMANESYLRGQEALVRAGQIENGKPGVIGVGVTAAIASGPRRGADRMHIAVRTLERTEYGYFEFQKGQGLSDREWQNEMAEAITLNSICAIAGVSQVPVDPSRITCHRGSAGTEGVRLAPVSMPAFDLAEPAIIWPDGTLGKVTDIDLSKYLIYPGSFRSFHCGHDLAARSAKDLTGKEVVFEISGVNKDKNTVDIDELSRRSVQFRGRYPVILRSDAAGFVDKAKVYPAGTQYVVGFDTATRILDKKYYNDSWAELNAALDYFDSRNARFHVLGRKVMEEGIMRFQTNRDIWCPIGKSHLFLGLAGQLDISATALNPGR